ncbi:MAG: GTPase [Thermofilaceae archaeon]
MPANLPPQAKAAWKRVEMARTKEERLQALIEFMSTVPRHKGTEKLLMQVRRQIARLREEIELEKTKRRSSGRGRSLFVEKEGDIQLVLLGFPNSGKSTLFKALTGVEVPCGEIPFETEKPQPGMMIWDGGVEIQVVDTPSLVPSESSSRNSLPLSLAYNADAIALVIDGEQDLLSQLTMLESMLRNRGIALKEERRKVVIERRGSGGVSVIGGRLRVNEVANLLRDYGIYHALVWLTDDASLDDVEAAILESTAYKPSVVIVTKLDRDAKTLAIVKDAASWTKVLCFDGTNSEELKDAIGGHLFRSLNLIRVYTSKDGEVSKKPLVLRRGARVVNVAERIHSRLVKEFKYALVWNERRFRFNPVKVGIDFELNDLDTIEIVA